jgi:hypothetical protein
MSASAVSAPPGIAGSGPRASALDSPAARSALNAALLTAIGAGASGDLQLLVSVPVTLIGAIVAWSAATRRPLFTSTRSTYSLLAAMATVALLAPSLAGARRWYEVGYRLYPAIGIVAIGIAAGGDARQRRAAVIVAVAGGALLYAVTPMGVPNPTIDVWMWIQTCGKALLHGVHPYTVTAPDAYGGAYDFGSTPTVLPYTPAVVLIAAPAIALFRDYRYAVAIALPLAAVLVQAAAKAMAADPETADAATLALILFPRSAQMVAFGYTDGFLVLSAAASLWWFARGRRTAEAIAFVMLPALKQYAAAPALVYAAMRCRRRDAAIAAAAALATVAPLLLWNTRATLDGILYLIRAPIGFRDDSDTLTAMVAQLVGWRSPVWLGVAAGFASAAVAAPLVRTRGMAGVLLASALSLILCFLAATQAFFNYYLVPVALLAFAAVTLTGRNPS